MNFKLGLHDKVEHKNLLTVSTYLNLSQTPPLPEKIDWNLALAVPPKLYANGPDPEAPAQIKDGIGDCFWVAGARAIQTRTANADQEFVPTIDDVLTAYGSTGFSLSDPAKTDQGTEMVAGLQYLQTTGIAGRKIGAFMAIDPTDEVEMLTCLWLFGPLMLGIMFPKDYELAKTWGVSKSKIIGGHAILGVARADSDEGLTIGTWGQDRLFAWEGVQTNCDQCFAILSPDWEGPFGDSPSGFDWEHLQSDFKALPKR